MSEKIQIGNRGSFQKAIALFWLFSICFSEIIIVMHNFLTITPKMPHGKMPIDTGVRI